MIEVTNVDHLGIRVTNETGSIAFYEQLGFKVERRADGDTVTILRNSHGIELNLVYNGVDSTGGKNILMDVPEKHTGYTHMALNVGSISKALYALREQNIAISQGPVSFGRSDAASVFIRDPDQNVIELRGNIAPGEQIEGLERYDPDA
ncbi:MAG: VOC family protein [Pseudomonadota bacterium]|nr:VOC family protein [Pseudomonadota bacterium]